MANSKGFKLSNPHLTGEDFLYHIGLSTNDNLAQRFGDVKFICMGGKASRMKDFANLIYKVLGKPKNCEFEASDNDEPVLKDLGASAGRYSYFKVGPVISANHGIGSASMSVVLHELLKLTHYSGCNDVTWIRIGTSGGLGIEPGTPVITEQSYNGLLEPCYKQVACGREIVYDTKTTADVAKNLLECAKRLNLPAMFGNTVGANDFFEEQGRLDGALCNHTEEDKMAFLKRAHDEFGVKNMEMESACFTAMCNRANTKCAVICVTLLNRLHGDQVNVAKEVLKSWENRPQEIVAEFIRSNC
ncbi:uridine phosphorylase 1-like [Clavelina lepadiformis]|uniref:Nucleoside phosphorylase domain-containing protein n=1 Tax=Clavelina lepadiformis TaxID=159417 RepID=A0ABP0FQ66_CLALP